MKKNKITDYFKERINQLKSMRWLYLIPIGICTLFSILYVYVDEGIAHSAFNEAAVDNTEFFKVLYNIKEQDISRVAAKDSLGIINYYNDTLVPALTNSPLTFGYTSPTEESVGLIEYAKINNFDFDSQTYTEYDTYIKGRGKTRVAIYRMSDDTYWVLGMFDNNMVKNQRTILAGLVFLMLFITTLLNFFIIYESTQLDYERTE